MKRNSVPPPQQRLDSPVDQAELIKKLLLADTSSNVDPDRVKKAFKTALDKSGNKLDKVDVKSIMR